MSRNMQTAKTLILGLVLVLCGWSSARGADETVENPLYNAWKAYRPGSMVRFEEIQDWEDTRIETRITYTLLARSREKAVIEKETADVMADDVRHAQKERLIVDARLPKDDPAVAPVPEAVQVKEIEEINILGRKTSCRVLESRLRQGTAEGFSRSYFHDDIPGGLVKKVDGMHAPEEKVHKTLVLLEFRAR